MTDKRDSTSKASPRWWQPVRLPPGHATEDEEEAIADGLVHYHHDMAGFNRCLGTLQENQTLGHDCLRREHKTEGVLFCLQDAVQQTKDCGEAMTGVLRRLLSPSSSESRAADARGKAHTICRSFEQNVTSLLANAEKWNFDPSGESEGRFTKEEIRQKRLAFFRNLVQSQTSTDNWREPFLDLARETREVIASWNNLSALAAESGFRGLNGQGFPLPDVYAELDRLLPETGGSSGMWQSTKRKRGGHLAEPSHKRRHTAALFEGIQAVNTEHFDPTTEVADDNDVEMQM